MDSPADNERGQWVTLAELAEFRRITKLSAARLVRRHRWRRQTDNQGRVRVLVPPDAIGARPDSPADSPADGPSVSPADIFAVIRPLEAAIDTLREQLGRAEQGREAERSRADRAEARADQQMALVQQYVAKFAGVRADADQARTAADALRQADAARRGLGRLARLRAAWRGE
jgi:hypothetical protein